MKKQNKKSPPQIYLESNRVTKKGKIIKIYKDIFLSSVREKDNDTDEAYHALCMLFNVSDDFCGTDYISRLDALTINDDGGKTISVDERVRYLVDAVLIVAKELAHPFKLTNSGKVLFDIRPDIKGIKPIQFDAVQVENADNRTSFDNKLPKKYSLLEIKQMFGVENTTSNTRQRSLREKDLFEFYDRMAGFISVCAQAGQEFSFPHAVTFVYLRGLYHHGVFNYPISIDFLKNWQEWIINTAERAEIDASVDPNLFSQEAKNGFVRDQLRPVFIAYQVIAQYVLGLNKNQTATKLEPIPEVNPETGQYYNTGTAVPETLNVIMERRTGKAVQKFLEGLFDVQTIDKSRIDLDHKDIKSLCAMWTKIILDYKELSYVTNGIPSGRYPEHQESPYDLFYTSSISDLLNFFKTKIEKWAVVEDMDMSALNLGIFDQIAEVAHYKRYAFELRFKRRKDGELYLSEIRDFNPENRILTLPESIKIPVEEVL